MSELIKIMRSARDCVACHGEGWAWDDREKRERPCRRCDGLGFRPVRAASNHQNMKGEARE
jgi:DnaJ-class molecular chaperone